MLGATMRGAPHLGVNDLEASYIRGARLFAVRLEGRAVGYALLSVDVQQYGAEGVIEAAAGRLPGVDMTADLLPLFEAQFRGVKAIRLQTARRGMVRKLERQGYEKTHYVMRKAVQ